MQSFVKIGFAQISLAAMPKISELPKIWGGGGGGVCCSPPAPMARTPMGAITFFSFKHIIVSFQFHITETGLQFVPSFKKTKTNRL